MASTLNRTEENAEAMRGGYAYQRMRLEASRNYHAIHVEGTRRMYLCGCTKGFIWPTKPSRLAKGRNADRRWAEMFKYR